MPPSSVVSHPPLRPLASGFSVRAMTSDSSDLAPPCLPETRLRTRDGRDARVQRTAPDEGLIYGEVAMHGPCVWKTDGRFRDAPFGAPGPLDLMHPAPASGSSDGVATRKVASVKEAIEADNRLFCCD